MDRLLAMRVFAQVAATGSFSATAEQMELSRAMVTRAIAELEQWLNARLLQRTTRRVSLTDAGEQFLQGCQQLLELSDKVACDLQDYNQALRGQLRLACSTSFAYAQMAGAVSDFLALHPQLKIDMNLSDVSVDLVDARIDLAIRITNNPDPMLVGRKLARCRSLVVAAPAYVARQGAPGVPDELVHHRCLAHAHVGRHLWHFSRASEATQVEINSHLSLNDANVLMQAVLAGSGIGLLPGYLVGPHIARGELLPLLPDWQVPEMSIYALYPSRRYLAPGVRALVDFLVARFATVQW